MDYKEITVTRVTPHIGAEIGNIDLTRPLSDAQTAELKAALAENLVLFFRDQLVSVENLRDLGQHFGALHRHVGPTTESRPHADYPDVRMMHFDADSVKVAGERWHTDQSCAEVPPLGSILYLHTVPPDGGGATLFASMYAAYDALSEGMKAYLAPLTATHDGSRAFGKSAPVNVHPVIAKHPVTGKKLLFVNRGQTSHLNGIPADESAGVLEFLYNHCAKPDFQVRFQWQPHSICFWDNRCTHHKAIWDYFPHTRSGFRVQIQGSQPPVPAYALQDRAA